MSMNVGPNRSCRESQFCSDHGRTVSLQPHIINVYFILQSHSDTPSVMTVKWRGEQPCRVTLPGYFILRTLLREYR